MRVKAVKFGRVKGRRLILGAMLSLSESEAQPLLKRGIVVQPKPVATVDSPDPEVPDEEKPVEEKSDLAKAQPANLSEASTVLPAQERATAKLQSEWLHVLAAGTWPGQHGTVTISPDDLREIAASYNPSLHESPVVIGHPVTDDPAWGWVRLLEVRSDGLWAKTDLQLELSELVHRQMYRKISVSLYPPDAIGNPVPGRYYLKHVGFLGAQAPAVKGLKPVALHASDAAISLSFKP